MIREKITTREGERETEDLKHDERGREIERDRDRETRERSELCCMGEEKREEEGEGV